MEPARERLSGNLGRSQGDIFRGIKVYKLYAVSRYKLSVDIDLGLSLLIGSDET